MWHNSFRMSADFANIVVLQRISIRGVVTTVDRRMVTGHAGCTYILVYRVKPCALFGRGPRRGCRLRAACRVGRRSAAPVRLLN